MELIEQIGSYAGLAAIVGLAILSALYFSQARDVRRLREAQEERAGAAAAQPQPTAVARKGNGQAAGVNEAATPPAGAPAAGTEGASAAPPPREATEGKPAEGAPVAAASQAPVKPAPNAPAAPAAPASGEGTAQRPIPRPAPPRLPPARPGAARRIPPLPGSTQQAKPPWYRRLAPRYIVLLVAGVLVLGAGAAFGIATLAGGGDQAASDGAVDQRAAGGDASPPLDPSTIEVAVLNGTSISGAAQSVSGTVEQAGFQIGNVANATEQTSAESAVLFAEGARSAAREVGRELDISQLEPVDADTQNLAGTADVVVVVGADQAE